MDKLWANAVRTVMNEVESSDKDKRRRLELLAFTLYRKALAGDITAIKEIGDRIDGRAHATTEVQLNSTQEFLKALRLLNGDSDRYSEGMEEAGGDAADLRNASPEGHA